jgi:RNA polymerase sigma-70 factor (ECF subfamily)
MSAPEVATVLDVSVDAVKSRLHRARIAVRQALAPMLGSPAIDRRPGSTCPDVLMLFSRHLEGDLDSRVCATMEAHLAQCPHCRGACDSLKRTLAVCRQLPTPDVPATLAATIKAAIRSFLDASQENSVTDRKR